MRRIAVALLALLPALTSIGPSAQEGAGPASIVPRYRAVQKTTHTRLLQVYGGPEVPPGLGDTGAYAATGKVAVFAGNFPPAGDKGDRRSALFVWDLVQQNFVKEIPLAGREISAIALTADGRRALLGVVTVDPKTQDFRHSLLWIDLTTGKEMLAFGSHAKYIQAVAVAPDGSHALSGAPGGLYYWDLRQGKEAGTFQVPADKIVAAIAFLPDGKRALTGWGGDVRLWDLAAGKVERTYADNRAATTVLALAVSGDGKHFAAADFGLSAGLWETDTGRALGTWHVDAQPPTALVAQVALSADGKSVYATWDTLNPGGAARESAILCRLNVGSAKPIWRQEVPMTGTVPLRLDGERLLVGGGPNLFTVRDVSDGRVRQIWGGPKGPINSLAYAADVLLLSAGHGGNAFRCKREDRQATAWQVHDAPINALAVSRDGKRLLAAGADKTLMLFDLSRPAPLGTLAGHAGGVTSVVFGADGTWAASGGDDRTVILWDLKTRKPRQRLEGHADRVNAVAVSPGGAWVASTSDDNTVRLWPIKDGRLDPDRDSVDLGGHTRPVLSVAFSPDGKRLLTAGRDMTLRLWDVVGQKLSREWKGHTNWVTAVAFLNPGVVLSASDDLTVRLWDAGTGQELDRIDLAEATDAPRSLAVLGPAEFAVGTSGWAVLRFAWVK